MPSLAEMIGGQPADSASLRQAVVTAAPTAGTAQIRMAGSTTDISGVKILAPATVANGDTVWVLQQGYVLMVIGAIARSAANWDGAAEFGNGIEIFHPGGTSYIDFHNTAAGVGTADYNMRMINDATGVLTVRGGRLVVDSTAVDNITATGSGATFRLDSRDGTGTWVMYATGATFRWWKGSDQMYLDANGLTVLARNYVGLSGAHGASYAQFSHSAMWNQTAYGYMQSSGGEVFLSTSGNMNFRVNNNQKMMMDTNAINFYIRLVLLDQVIHSRTYGDDWHVHGWWSGNDGWRITEYGGLYFRVRDQDPAFEIFATGVSRFRKFDQIGAYDTSAIVTYSLGGGTGAKIGLWSGGQNAAQILKCWGSTIEGRTWDDAGWGIINADLNDMSTVEGKTNVKRLAKITKAGHKAKMQRLEPIHYVRKTDEDDRCVNCLATGKARKAAGDGFTDEPCPDCTGTKKKPLDKSQKKNAATGFLSFAAEEMAVEFPEAVHFDLDESPVAIKPISVVAILWEQVKDLEERLAAAEGTIQGMQKK